MTRRVSAWFCGAFASVLAFGAGAEDVSATLHWARKAELSTPVSGVVASVAVEPGERVDKGDILMRLDSRSFEYGVRRARARVESTKKRRAEAQRELERTQELYDRTLIAMHELDLAKIALARAEADHQAALAERDQAQLDLEHSVIRAPFDAWVLARHAEPGETVVTRLQSEPLIVVAEAGRMMARALVGSGRADALSGRTVRVRVGEREYEGRVVQVGMDPVTTGEQTARYAVRVEFAPRSEERLRAGTPATVELP